jgi:hypothetical protein
MSNKSTAHLSLARGELVEGVWEDLLIEFDVLCQAAQKYLRDPREGSHFSSSLGTGWDSRLEKLPDGRFSYALVHWELGRIGTMIISKRPENKSQIEFKRTLAGDRESTAEELAALPPGEARVNAYLKLREKISQETEELDRSRMQYMGNVVDVFFRKLEEDRFLSLKYAKTENQEGTSPATSGQAEEPKQEPWRLSRPEKRDRDKIIWEMHEDGATWRAIVEKIDDQGLGGGVNTVKENYKRMKALAEKENTR